MSNKHKRYFQGKEIVPVHFSNDINYAKLVENYEKTFAEARNVAEAARLYERMINENSTIWLGISGIPIVGGMGGYIIDLIKKGHIDVICTTGAQAYHDLHYAFGAPVKQGSPHVNDNKLRQEGIVRIYDTFIDEKHTLFSADEQVMLFLTKKRHRFKYPFSSADFNYELGNFILEMADSGLSERSFLAQAAKYKVPVYWDSLANHSIGMNLAKLFLEDIDINPSPSMDVLESAAIVYGSEKNSFVLLGGGGPKNFIQQTGPALSQILGLEHDGADKGIQITTATEKDGGLSGCTFSEGHTWGKYKDASKGLVQVWGEMSVIAPIILGYAWQNCRQREHKKLIERKKELYENLKKAVYSSCS